MSYGTSSWARLTFTPSTGEISVDGDLFAVLGVNSGDLIHSADPFKALPDSVARSLIEGDDITRDEDLSLVILPGKTAHKNTVTLIAEKIIDDDLVSDMAAGVVGFAPDGTIKRWNMRMTHLFGPREKDVKGRNASDILPNPVLYDWSSVISSAHFGHEVRIEFKPSGDKKVEGVLSRGGPGVIGLFQDSTESYKIAKRLRALNRLNQAYLQSTGTGLLLLDSRLRILLSNSGFSKITGYRGSLIGLQLHDVLSEESYKWFHDASEHLFAEERSEQTGVVSFTTRDGQDVLLRQTLRAVRNETNATLNFVCLLEDETKLTLLENEVSHLKTNLLALSRISSWLWNLDSSENTGICREILRLTRSRAVAEYLYDSYETVKLVGFAGDWPRGFPVQELREFGFPAFVWGGDKQYIISALELGNLSDCFKSCVVLPIGTGVDNRGFLILAEPVLSDSDSDILNTVASMVKFKSDISRERKARSVAEKHLELNEGFSETILDGIPLPIAIIGMDGKIDHWNRAMELVCGVNASEAGIDDVNNLIDPDGAGFTLDSRASLSTIEECSPSNEWAVIRKDRSVSPIYRWTVSVVDRSAGYCGDPAFLVSGVLAGSRSCFVDENNSLDRSNGNIFRQTITDLLKVSNQHDVLYLLYRICILMSGAGAMEFTSKGKLVATFPVERDDSLGPLSCLISRNIEGELYQIRASNSIDQSSLDAAISLIEFRRVGDSQANAFPESIQKEIMDYSNGLVSYMEHFCSDSIEQNNAILHIVDKSDPLAGFARTMLYSNETASRVSHLLKLSIQLTREGFSREYPDRFLMRLHRIFSNRGLRPPSLSLVDKMPQVFIIAEVILQCFGLLCQLVVLDGVVSFKARKAGTNEEPGVLLTLEGLNDQFLAYTREKILEQLEFGRFNSETEVAIIFRLLEVAGCSLTFAGKGELVFTLKPVL